MSLAENKKYLQTKVDPILKKLVKDLLVNKPDDVIGFVMEWCKLKGANFRKKGDAKDKQEDQPSDEDEEQYTETESEEDDYIDDLPIRKPAQRQPRQSVSAEVYGVWNKKEDYVPKVIEKSHEQQQKINERLSQSFMFSALDPKEKEIVINAMEIKEFEDGEFVIREGDDGDNLYVVEKGKLDCFKVLKKGDPPTYLKTYQPGESFGELALLYNAPRAASIKAVTHCTLFALDRECFNNIVKDAAIKRRNKYEEFLTKVKLLENLDNYERTKICDALKTLRFSKGEFIIKQGEQGDSFFMLEEGECVATKVLTEGEPAQEVYAYKEGDYFGELALIKDQPRQANIIAKSDSVIAALDRKSFKRLLGPLEKIMQRQTKKYVGYQH